MQYTVNNAPVALMYVHVLCASIRFEAANVFRQPPHSDYVASRVEQKVRCDFMIKLINQPRSDVCYCFISSKCIKTSSSLRLLFVLPVKYSVANIKCERQDRL